MVGKKITERRRSFGMRLIVDLSKNFNCVNLLPREC